MLNLIDEEITVPYNTPQDSNQHELNYSEWLRKQATDKYTIQLGSVISENDIIKYIKGLNLGEKAGYIVVIVNGITRYTAIYGIYDTYDNAEFAITQLPSSIQKTRPWVRNTGILQDLLR